jgi:hypothetical protein
MSAVIDPHWVSNHLDSEMDFILKSELDRVKSASEKTREAINSKSYAQSLAEAFTGVLHDREPETKKLFAARDLSPLSNGVFRANERVTDNWFTHQTLFPLARELAFAWLTYVQALKLGAPSPAMDREIRALWN